MITRRRVSYRLFNDKFSCVRDRYYIVVPILLKPQYICCACI
jgi:hypothetical protein